jgi:hypothetical protein
MLMLSVAIFVASRLIEPVLARLVGGAPQFMGVPVPMVVLGVHWAGAARPALYSSRTLRVTSIINPRGMNVFAVAEKQVGFRNIMPILNLAPERLSTPARVRARHTARER